MLYFCFVVCFPLSSYVLCFLFLYVFLCVLCFRLVFLSFCICNRKNNTYKHRKHINTQRKSYKTNQKNNRNLPARPLEIFIFRGDSWAGNPVFLFCLFFFECLCVLYVSLFVYFRLVLLSFCMYNRTNTYKNIKQT